MYSIKFGNLSKSFGEKLILDNVNIEFCHNKTYLIIGESGVGKTTLLNIIAGYEEFDSGEIAKDENLKIEYLFQEDMLFSNLTVYENMYIKYCAKTVTLHDKEDEYVQRTYHDKFEDILNKFNMYDYLERKVSLLSGGEKQRVQLSNILLTNPDIILMDEPVSKLDKSNKLAVLEKINEVFEYKTIIIVDHNNKSLYENATILILVGGKLIYE